MPLNKFLAIQKNDEIVELSRDLKNKIKFLIKVKPKAPWYTYLGLIIASLCLVFIFGEAEYERYKNKQFEKAEFETKNRQNINKFSSLSTNSYLKLGGTSIDHYVHDKYAKVEKIAGDSILLKKIYPDKHYKNEEDIGRYYLLNKSILDSFWISKKNLRNTILENYDTFTSNDRTIGFNFFNENPKLIIEDILTIDKTIFIEYIEGSRTEKEYNIILKNYGVPCSIVKIETISNSDSESMSKWINQLPQFLPTSDNIGENFTLKYTNERDVASTYDFLLYLKSIHGKIYKFHIKQEMIASKFAPKIEKVR